MKKLKTLICLVCYSHINKLKDTWFTYFDKILMATRSPVFLFLPFRTVAKLPLKTLVLLELTFQESTQFCSLIWSAYLFHSPRSLMIRPMGCFWSIPLCLLDYISNFKNLMSEICQLTVKLTMSCFRFICSSFWSNLRLSRSI